LGHFDGGKTKPILKGRRKYPEVRIQKEKIENKANLLNVQMVLTSNITKRYGNFKSLIKVKNKPNLSLMDPNLG
jgi:hypothetical protein